MRQLDVQVMKHWAVRWRIGMSTVGAADTYVAVVYQHDSGGVRLAVETGLMSRDTDALYLDFAGDSEVGRLLLVELHAKEPLPPFALLDVLSDMSPELRRFIDRIGYKSLPRDTT